MTDHPLSNRWFRKHPHNVGQVCGCEFGNDCSRITVCCAQSWVEQANDEAHAVLLAIEDACDDHADGAPDRDAAASLANQILAILEYGPKGCP